MSAAPLLTSQKQVARDSKYTIVNDQRKAATKVQQAARGPASNRKQKKNPEPSEMRSVAGRTCKAASRNEFSDAYGPDRSQQADTYEMKASKWCQTK